MCVWCVCVRVCACVSGGWILWMCVLVCEWVFGECVCAVCVRVHVCVVFG